MTTTFSVTGNYKLSYANDGDMEWFVHGAGIDLSAETELAILPGSLGKARLSYGRNSGFVRVGGERAGSLSEDRLEAALLVGWQWMADEKWKFHVAAGYATSLGTLDIQNQKEELIPYRNCGGLEIVTKTTQALACVFQQISSLHTDSSALMEGGVHYAGMKAEVFVTTSFNDKSYSQTFPQYLMRFGIRAGIEF